jgi:CRISPR/Cas system-associated endonuclease Cas3-HD
MKIKHILITLFWRQNNYHQHGVLFHTLRVTFEVIKSGHHRMIPAGLLHDIGKPFCAIQKPEDIINNEWSFTDHETYSWQLIRSIPFISEYTKQLVRYHYIIRRMAKTKEKGMTEYLELKKEWDLIPKEMQKEIALFMKLDDRGKGSKAFLNKRKN